MIAAVAAFSVDVGFIEGPQTHPDLVVRPWLSDQMLIVAAPHHPLAASRQVRIRQLREAADRWLIEHLGQVNVGFEIGSPEAIRQLVAAGAAVGCMSRYAVAPALAQGTLVALKTRLPPALRRLAIVVHKDKHLGRATKDFLLHCATQESERRS